MGCSVPSIRPQCSKGAATKALNADPINQLIKVKNYHCNCLTMRVDYSETCL